ncbi:MAG: sigma-70 family RNA polymerase sigma factor [Gemmatimonadetes bacterium]|nr:sigma-70 family RNA polymerase sigma factor [Gemmatimonadota bacterium]
MSVDPPAQKGTDEEADGAVVARVRAGDREAYRILVRRYQDLLYRHALRVVGDGDLAADLVQGALVKAYAEIRRCRDPERFGAWVFRILVNGCKDHLKSRRRRDVPLEEAPIAATAGRADPARDLDRSELAAVLEDALARLPESLREAFLLKHVEGRSYDEIATMLDASVPALKMRVHRAREALKAMLEEVL